MRTTEGVLHRSTIAWLVVCATLVGCSPAPQNGTNTNWVCRVDAECTERDPGSTCQAGFCVNNHSASNASGSTDTTASESSGTTTPGGFESAASNGSRIGGALNAVTATDDGWFAIGYRNTPDQHALVATSSDARNWKVVDAPGDAYMLTSVAFGNGTVVSVHPTPTGSHVVVKPPGGPPEFRSIDIGFEEVVFGNGVFVGYSTSSSSGTARAGRWVSNDGIQWSPAGVYASWRGFVDGQFFAWNSGVSTSADGVTWTAPTAPNEPMAAYTLTASKSEILGLGFDQHPGQEPAPSVAPVPPALVFGARRTPLWTLSEEPGPWSSNPWAFPLAIAASDTRVVVMSHGFKSGSYGEVWTTALPYGSEQWQLVDIPSDWALVDVKFSAGVFVAAGGRVTAEVGFVNFVATSPDGIIWHGIDLTN